MKKIIKNILIILIMLAGICLFILTNHTGGWRAYTVMSASMEPTIMTGSLVLVQKIKPVGLKKGDIITFTPPTKERISVTHRIYSLKKSKENITLKTKGDNNKSIDPWTVTESAVAGKVIYSIPYIGYGFTFLKSKVGILLFIILPSMWIIVDEINSIINLFKAHRRNKTLAKETKIIGLLILLGCALFYPKSTFALLSHSVNIGTNSYTVISITNTPSPTEIPTATSIPTQTPAPTQIPAATQAPTAVPSYVPTQTPTPTLTLTPTNPPQDFPSCATPRGKIIASYKIGVHAIIGVGLLKGSDVVYQLTEGSKEKVLQCYCNEAGRGIQTNWLRTSEIDKYKDPDWPYSISNGLSWNLDNSPYVAQNIDYECK